MVRDAIQNKVVALNTHICVHMENFYNVWGEKGTICERTKNKVIIQPVSNISETGKLPENV